MNRPALVASLLFVALVLSGQAVSPPPPIGLGPDGGAALTVGDLPLGDVQSTGLWQLTLSNATLVGSVNTSGWRFLARYDGGVGSGSCEIKQPAGAAMGSDGGWLVELRRYFSDGGYLNSCTSFLREPFDAGVFFPFICTEPLYAGALFQQYMDAGATIDTAVSVAFACNIGWPYP